MSFYTKNNKGEYLPVEFNQVISKDWNNQMVIVTVGSDERPATDQELEETQENLDNAAVLKALPNTSFLITSYAIQFEVLSSLDDLKKQCVSVRVTGDDDLSKLGGLQKHAKDTLRKKAKKVAILPTPLSVEDYHEVMQIKRRCDLRRSRRGR